MKPLSREKKQRLLLVMLGTAAALAGVWFGLVRPQRLALEEVARKIEQSERQLSEARKLLSHAPQVQKELEQVAAILEQHEEQMASGDYYAFLINRIRQFRLGYQLDIPQFSTISGPAAVDVLPGFPYQQVSLTIAGTGHYHEIGRFIADFENQFPYCQIRNVELETAGSGPGETSEERLAFRMTVVTLVRPET